MKAGSDHEPAASRPARLFIIALMAVGSAAVWGVNPVLWLWIGSRLSQSRHLALGPYLLLLGGIIATAVAIAVGLARLNQLYGA